MKMRASRHSLVAKDDLPVSSYVLSETRELSCGSEAVSLAIQSYSFLHARPVSLNPDETFGNKLMEERATIWVIFLVSL